MEKRDLRDAPYQHSVALANLHYALAQLRANPHRAGKRIAAAILAIQEADRIVRDNYEKDYSGL